MDRITEDLVQTLGQRSVFSSRPYVISATATDEDFEIAGTCGKFYAYALDRGLKSEQATGMRIFEKVMRKHGILFHAHITPLISLLVSNEIALIAPSVLMSTLSFWKRMKVESKTAMRLYKSERFQKWAKDDWPRAQMGKCATRKC